MKPEIILHTASLMEIQIIACVGHICSQLCLLVSFNLRLLYLAYLKTLGTSDYIILKLFPKDRLV